MRRYPGAILTVSAPGRMPAMQTIPHHGLAVVQAGDGDGQDERRPALTDQAATPSAAMSAIRALMKAAWASLS
jgi:hypothetical protein